MLRFKIVDTVTISAVKTFMYAYNFKKNNDKEDLQQLSKHTIVHYYKTIKIVCYFRE